MNLELLLIIGLVVLVLWRIPSQPEKLKKKFVKSLLHSKPIVPKHDAAKSIGANIPSLVTNDDRAFFNDFVDFGAVVNWWFANGQDDSGNWRLQELPDTELRIGFYDEPRFGRRYDIFYNQVQTGELEVSPSARYAETRKVYASLEVRWVRLLSLQAVHELLAGISTHICDEQTETRAKIDHAISQVLWQSQQIDTLDLGANYGDLELHLNGAAVRYFQGREAFRKHAAA